MIDWAEIEGIEMAAPGLVTKFRFSGHHPTGNHPEPCEGAATPKPRVDPASAAK